MLKFFEFKKFDFSVVFDKKPSNFWYHWSFSSSRMEIHAFPKVLKLRLKIPIGCYFIVKLRLTLKLPIGIKHPLHKEFYISSFNAVDTDDGVFFPSERHRTSSQMNLKLRLRWANATHFHSTSKMQLSTTNCKVKRQLSSRWIRLTLHKMSRQITILEQQKAQQKKLWLQYKRQVAHTASNDSWWVTKESTVKHVMEVHVLKPQDFPQCQGDRVDMSFKHGNQHAGSQMLCFTWKQDKPHILICRSWTGTTRVQRTATTRWKHQEILGALLNQNMVYKLRLALSFPEEFLMTP